MSKSVLKRWHGADAMGGAGVLFRVLFQLSTTFVILVRACFDCNQ